MLDIAVFAAATVAVLLLLAYFQAPILVWTIAAGLVLATWAAALQLSAQTNAVLFFLFIVVAPVLTIPALRRRLLSDHVLEIFRRILPDMSQTEKEAIDAGTVWWTPIFSPASRTGTSCSRFRSPGSPRKNRPSSTGPARKSAP